VSVEVPELMTHVLELSDETYQRLQRAAENEGVTPVEWLEATKSVAEALTRYIGSVDSRTHTPDAKYRSEFGDIVDEKMAKQGSKPPEWQR
jgi:hypothetical protein